MATLMEKDVLLEVVADGLGLIARVTNYDLNLNEDTKQLCKIRNYLYSTFEDEIDYEKVLNECKAIKSKWQKQER